ncbi:hypothetical protein ACKC5Q_05140 [Aeromonas dhakensis]|uniref:hypothetical protein n=1 Tax=Aeromonas dhakensis TaxID=196024 RepID=UPI0038B61321
MQNTKAMKAHFKNFTLFVNSKSNVGEINGKRIHTYSINSVSIKNNANGVTSNLKTKLTEKQIGKLLTAVGHPNQKDGKSNAFGKAMRTAVKKLFDMNCVRDAYTQNGTDLKEKESAFAFVDATGGKVKIWIIDVDYKNQYAKCFIDRVVGTITCIVCEENEDKQSTCGIYQELICDNNGREGRANPFAKGTNMTHHLSNMNKIETRGRKAKKVDLPISINSTHEENNAVTVQIKEVTNHNADVLDEVVSELTEVKSQLDELEMMKAKMAAMEAAMKAQSEEMNQLKALVQVNRRPNSVFGRPVSTSKQDAMVLDMSVEEIKAMPFDFGKELERI